MPMFTFDMRCNAAVYTEITVEAENEAQAEDLAYAKAASGDYDLSDIITQDETWEIVS